MNDPHLILDVTEGRPLADGAGVEVLVTTASGRATLRVAEPSVLPLGALLLEAATSTTAPGDEPIRVVEIRHQAQPDGRQTLGLRTATGHVLWVSLESSGAEALRDMLLSAIGPPPPLSGGAQGPVN